MRDHTQPETQFSEPLSRLMRARAARRHADEAEERAKRDLALCGVNGRAVDLALSLFEANLRSDIEDQRQAGQVLAALRSPVRIELAHYFEHADAVKDGRAEEIAYDEGYFARMEGASRTVRARNESEGRAWKAGWDQADSDITAA